tara:strand:+ start:321 stop:509 length:189 start_codon:yes stop_codon:yes gene_type:complete
MRRVDKLLEDIDHVRHRVTRLSGQDLLERDFADNLLEKIIELRVLTTDYLEKYDEEVRAIVG